MAAKKITPRIDRLIADNYGRGLSIRQLADIVDLSYDTVRQSLKRSGIRRRPPRAPHSYTQYDDQIKRLYLENFSTRDIARQLHLTPMTVARYLKRLGVPLRDRIEAIIISHQVR